MNRRIFLSILVLASSSASFAEDKVDSINKNRQGVAVEGYDVTAYFQQGKPVKGSDKFAYTWMGATWRFASAAGRDAFAAQPEKYAPQYGGYCAYAVSEGHTASIDPEAWKIVDGKLYLNYSKSVRVMWEKDIPGRVERADHNWPSLHK
jgi:YHS domain-containing protein